MMGPIMGGAPLLKFTGEGVNIVCDGNSLVAGFAASGPTAFMPAQLAQLAPLNGQISVANVAVSGQTIANMQTRAPVEVDARYVQGKRNILITWEGTNTIGNSGKTGIEAGQMMAQYCADRLAANHDWLIVLMTTIPTYAPFGLGVAGTNAQFIAYNDYLKMNCRAMGAKCVVDTRAAGIFVYNGTTAMSPPMSAYMAENIHCNDAGYGLIAQYVADVLKRLPAR